MTTNLRVGDTFPNLELPDHRDEPCRLSGFTRPGLLDEKLGFVDGYPLIVVFGRGFFCPRDQQQMRQLVGLQSELAVNYCKLVMVSADPPMVKSIRIPQQEWDDRTPSPGADGLPAARGVVRWLDIEAGVGTIASDVSNDDVFFHFTAIPGEGYRTLRPDTPIGFEVVKSEAGLTARNVQRL